MSEWFQSLGPVEWFREQFAGCPEGVTDCDSISAQDMFQFVLIAWLIAAVVLIALDRLGSGLFGRSRPLAQVPPTRARTWRWRRQTPPENYSLLPPGTALPTPEQAPSIDLVETVNRPELTTRSEAATQPNASANVPSAVSSGSLIGATITNAELWRAYSNDPVPTFGLENQERLAQGLAPERYNPVSGRVESLHRNTETAEILWPGTPQSVTTIGPSKNADFEEEE